MRSSEENKLYMREYYAKNREKQLASQKKFRKTAKYRKLAWAKYGIKELDKAEEMFKGQKVCQICGGGPAKNHTRLSLDHCHETGKPRGMLCSKCNKALGLLGDNIEGVEKALDYLRKSKS